MSKIGLYTDFHLHLWRSFGKDPKEGLPIRFIEQLKVQDQMRDTFIHEKCGLVVDGGDGFHIDSAIPIEVFNVKTRFTHELRKAGIRQEIVEGNHTISKKARPTWINRAYYSFLDDPNDAEYPSKEFTFGNAKIKLYGYSDETPVEKVKGFDIVVVHKQPVVTNKFGYTYDGVDWKVLAKNNRYVFFGHYHVNQELAKNCWIMGPPMHLAFGDEGPRGIWIVDDETWEVKFIKMDYPDFITVETPEDVKDDKNYYRVLNSKTRVKSDRVITSVVPEHFEERIKSDDFLGIISEWATLHKKEKEYIDAIVPIATQKMKVAKNVFEGRISLVRIKDFFSIGNVQYVVKDGFHIVTGKNEDFDSNGSGKTSLFEAIYWCFFGKTTKGSLRADELIRDGEKDCEVEVHLIHQGKNTKDGYVFHRSKKEGLKVYDADFESQIWNDLTDGKTKPECEKILFDILGIDEKVYLSSCYFSQENIMMLTGLGDADRTNMITDLLGFETYDDIHDACKEKCAKLEAEIHQFDKDTEVIQRDIDWIVRTQGELKKKLVETEKQLDDKSHSEDKLNKDIKVLAEQLSALIEPKVDVLNLNKKISSISEKMSTNKLETIDLQNCLSELQKKGNRFATELSAIHTTFNYEKKKREDFIKELAEIESSQEEKKFCKHCGSMITSENRQSIIENLKNDIKTINPSLIGLKEKYAFMKKDFEQHQLEIMNVKKEIGEYEEKYFQLNEELDGVKSQRNSLLIDVKEYESKKESLEKQIKSTNNFLIQTQNDFRNLMLDKKMSVKKLDDEDSKLIERKEAIKNVLLRAETNKKDFEIFTFWKDAFSTTGIRTVLLDRFCNDFNVILNQYLSLISNGIMSIVVSPTKKIGGGAERNKIGILINNNGIERNYLALSGGEKRRVDVSLCMGLNKWVSEKYRIQGGLLGIIILDELFSFVDRLGEEAIAGLLFQEGSNRAIFVISHTPEIGSYTRNVWTVVKQGGVSHLQIEEG